MFENIGGKIKKLAIVLTVIGIIASFVVGILMAVAASNLHQSQLGGILVIILGSILSWISSFVLYGFGQLIESTCNIEKAVQSGGLSTSTDTNASSVEPDFKSSDDMEKLEYYKRLLDNGRITKEEFIEMRKMIIGQ